MAPPRPTYTASQLDRYFTHINFPQHEVRHSVSSLDISAQLSFLHKLQQYQLVAVTFENLSLHYNPSRLNSLDPGDLFAKIVDNAPSSIDTGGPGGPKANNRRGGFCMENNQIGRAHV